MEGKKTHRPNTYSTVSFLGLSKSFKPPELFTEENISQKFRSSFLITMYTSLGAILPPKYFNEMAPRY